KIIQYLKKYTGKKNLIVGIGDGLSDRCMAHEVDCLFARDSLKNYCEINNIYSHKFDDFRDVQKTLDGLLNKLLAK
ncbi:hypothetical protein KKB40_05405, partial [Patescibacteria group bacterium]|nr:hypothetical protein [Patescibacteria group bacterium]